MVRRRTLPAAWRPGSPASERCRARSWNLQPEHRPPAVGELPLTHVLLQLSGVRAGVPNVGCMAPASEAMRHLRGTTA